jgi:2-haloacid dehalogenase
MATWRAGGSAGDAGGSGLEAGGSAAGAGGLAPEAAGSFAEAAGSAWQAVVFDLGGVLIDWNPRHLYGKLIADPVEMERFLAEVTTSEWNHRQDEGRTWDEAVAELVALHPSQADLIRAYHERWEEMLGASLPGSVAILAELRGAAVPVYAITNWSSDKFRLSRPRYPFLEWFDDIVVSGDEGVAKPDPALFRVLFSRHGIDPRRAILVDDTEPNIRAAIALGMTALHFRDAATLRADLVRLGLPVAVAEAASEAAVSAPAPAPAGSQP